jgi:hypothetical protein
VSAAFAESTLASKQDIAERCFDATVNPNKTLKKHCVFNWLLFRLTELIPKSVGIGNKKYEKQD